MHAKLKYLPILFLLIFSGSEIYAQAFPGYTLFCPSNSRYSYLCDLNNTIVHSWYGTKSGAYSCYLLEDGSLLRSAVSSNSQLNGGGATGIVQRYSWQGALEWEYTYSSSTYRSHHDIEPMPNGNVLLIAWEVKTAAQAVQAGLNHSAVIWPDHIIEVQPVGTNGGNIVWKWHVWDHLIQDFDPTKSNYGVVGNHPELLDINCSSSGSGDWTHINGISYNAQLDQIVISSHELDEIYVIDHSTTTQQAAGHTGGIYGKGGDFLYRWGRPSNYDAPGPQVFNVVHSSIWVPAGYPGEGNILAFNNREGQGTSVVVEINPPRDSLGGYLYVPGTAFAPTSPNWNFTASWFYSNHLGGCQRLPNGNTIISEATSGYMFEVNPAGTVVWSYARGGEIPRLVKYGIDYPGLLYLPVQLTSFTAEVNSNTVTLHWSTASENNNRGFEIQRSTDESRFEVLAFIEGQGTSTEVNEYKYADNSCRNGKYYYRLKQIDLDGSFEYSSTIEIDFNSKLNFKLEQNYPNPFNPATKILYSIGAQSHVVLQVFNSIGELVTTLINEVQDSGSYDISFNTGYLPSGIYFYRLAAGDFSETKQMLLIK